MQQITRILDITVDMHALRQQSFGDVVKLTYHKQRILITNRQFALQAHVRH